MAFNFSLPQLDLQPRKPAAFRTTPLPSTGAFSNLLKNIGGFFSNALQPRTGTGFAGVGLTGGQQPTTPKLDFPTTQIGGATIPASFGVIGNPNFSATAPPPTRTSTTGIPGVNFTPVPPNTSTLSGPVYTPPPSFSTPPTIPQVTQQGAQGATIGGGTTPPTSSTPTTPSGLTFEQAMAIQTQNAQPQPEPALPAVTATGAGQAGSPITTGGFGAGGGLSSASVSSKAVQDAEIAYQQALQISPEELSTQEDIDKLSESTRSAYRNLQNQPIPLQFITGQLAATERRALGLAEPLERKLARLQAQRTGGLEASKFALERADKERERIGGQKGSPFTLGEGQTRFDEFGNVVAQGPQKSKEAKAPTTIQTDQGIVQWNPETGQWEQTGFGRPTSEAASIRAAEKAEKATEKAETKQASMRRGVEQANNAITAIDTATSILDKSGILNPFVATAVGRAIGSFLPGEMAQLQGAVATVKALVGFGALEEMRRASPTGGALGQVSERELSFLQSTIASLNLKQDDITLTNNLKQIKNSFQRVKAFTQVESGVPVTVRVTSQDGETATFTVGKDDLNKLILEGNQVEFL